MQQIAKNARKIAADKFHISLDYSEYSLAKLDSLLQQAYDQNKKQATSEKAIQNTARVWGSYLGEVMQRKWGGEWIISGTQVLLKINGENSVKNP